jgi:hypothetical protein
MAFEIVGVLYRRNESSSAVLKVGNGIIEFLCAYAERFSAIGASIPAGLESRKEGRGTRGPKVSQRILPEPVGTLPSSG